MTETDTPTQPPELHGTVMVNDTLIDATLSRRVEWIMVVKTKHGERPRYLKGLRSWSMHLTTDTRALDGFFDSDDIEVTFDDTDGDTYIGHAIPASFNPGTITSVDLTGTGPLEGWDDD